MATLADIVTAITAQLADEDLPTTLVVLSVPVDATAVSEVVTGGVTTTLGQLQAARSTAGTYAANISPVVDTADYALGLEQVVSYLTRPLDQTLTGTPVSGTPQYALSDGERIILKRYGIQYVESGYGAYQLGHGFTWLEHPDNGDIIDGLRTMHGLRSLATLVIALRQRLQPYLGTSYADEPPTLAPVVSDAVNAVSTIKDAQFDLEYQPVEGIVTITIIAELYGEMTFSVSVRF